MMPANEPDFANGAPPAGRSLIGSGAPPHLDHSTSRLLHDVRTLVDRGLEHAEAVVHERRQDDERIGYHDPRTVQALEALGHVRQITRNA